MQSQSRSSTLKWMLTDIINSMWVRKFAIIRLPTINLNLFEYGNY